ncbi:carbohydrate porin [Methylobacterium sp. J-090]|uniref:carbohydrate porin n=1 Tax=Methylobacterium sp. J-090 TaxID=2836666 RepID=UPI001FBA52C7|nr:carbohydrate porin [Methylobacterium sp. J-090]MCJ2084224.1 carbohydrate porin [Methylobacterium sp. J-090]
MPSDTALCSGTRYPVRSSEIGVGASFPAQVMPGRAVQPTAQFIVRSAGGIPKPFATGLTRIGDASVLGQHSTVRY